jgi:3'(2'), 5'-bisphosphate nucleotidase
MTTFRIDDLIDATREAGETAMAFIRVSTISRFKDDNSPVTEADFAVDNLLYPQLTERYPDIPVVTEERAATHEVAPGRGRFFLVDPIDGTKEFIKKTGEFTINIALIENGHPAAGIVHAPAIGACSSARSIPEHARSIRTEPRAKYACGLAVRRRQRSPAALT